MNNDYIKYYLLQSYIYLIMRSYHLPICLPKLVILVIRFIVFKTWIQYPCGKTNKYQFISAHLFIFIPLVVIIFTSSYHSPIFAACYTHKTMKAICPRFHGSSKL